MKKELHPTEFTHGPQLKAYRRLKGKSQDAYAKFLGYTTRGYQAIENGEKPLSERMLREIKSKFKRNGK